MKAFLSRQQNQNNLNQIIMKKSLVLLIVAAFLLQSCAKVFYTPDARYLVYSGLIDPSFRVIDPFAGGNNPEGRSL